MAAAVLHQRLLPLPPASLHPYQQKRPSLHAASATIEANVADAVGETESGPIAMASSARTIARPKDATAGLTAAAGPLLPMPTPQPSVMHAAKGRAIRATAEGADRAAVNAATGLHATHLSLIHI